MKWFREHEDDCGLTPVLSTGRILPENGEFRFSPGPNGDLFHGYDGSGVATFSENDQRQETEFHDDDGNEIPLSVEERREIADYMIAAWNRWAETGNP